MTATNWYYEVNDYCLTLSEAYGIPLIKVAGILSALSPNNTFKGNCNSLEKFLEFKTDCKVSTFNGQKEKAKQIYNMVEPTESKIKAVLGGLKTQAFFCNIYQPYTSESVCIDLWMIRYARRLKLIPQEGTLTPKRYGIVEQAVREYADKLNLRPHETQALIWVDIRGSQW